MNLPQQEYWTIEELTESWTVSVSEIRYWVETGKLKLCAFVNPVTAEAILSDAVGEEYLGSCEVSGLFILKRKEALELLAGKQVTIKNLWVVHENFMSISDWDPSKEPTTDEMWRSTTLEDLVRLVYALSVYFEPKDVILNEDNLRVFIWHKEKFEEDHLNPSKEAGSGCEIDVQPRKASYDKYLPAREMSREIAEDRWSEDETIQAGVIANDIYPAIAADLKALGLDKPPTTTTIKNWIKPLAPDTAKRRGRPTTKSTK